MSVLLLESDGLLSVNDLPSGSLSFQADYLARQHPAEASGDVRDFHALTQRYYEKLLTVWYPEAVEGYRRHRQRQSEGREQ